MMVSQGSAAMNYGVVRFVMIIL